MERSTRLSRLLQILNDRPMTSVDELAARLGVSDRTIYRDLTALKGDGVAVQRRAQIGYALQGGDAALDLSGDELEALAAGAQMIAAWGDPALAGAAVRMLDKVAGALSPGQQATLDGTPIAASRARTKFRRVAGLGLLRQALHERRKLYFRYVDSEGHHSERVVQPRSLVFRGDHWSLLAWCEIREEYRSFRPERMRDVAVLDETFLPFDGDGVRGAVNEDTDPAFDVSA
ncbi:MAG: YafY family transcriptional regulator [Myxococcales bacterium]|nr:YafY family transcriptional regulator [Myxococcales bacterium]